MTLCTEKPTPCTHMSMCSTCLCFFNIQAVACLHLCIYIHSPTCLHPYMDTVCVSMRAYIHALMCLHSCLQLCMEALYRHAYVHLSPHIMLPISTRILLKPRFYLIRQLAYCNMALAKVQLKDKHNNHERTCLLLKHRYANVNATQTSG